MTWWAFALAIAGAVPAALRWLRVAQREHYLAGSVTRFAGRWWRVTPWNPILVGLGVAAIGVALWAPMVGIVAVAAAVAGPIGLGIKGSTAPLAWTDRLKRLTVAVGVACLVVAAAGLAVPAIALATPLLVPVLVDAALAMLAPLEHRRGTAWVARAAERIAEVGPEVVAITGSYGKTSTKGIVAHLLEGSRTVLASPASFNNRMGLARTVNEHLAPGTQVFVAEMGTYGAGEIREMCRFVPPRVGVITAIGPVHLERMRSEERIAAAKREILERAEVAVLQVDYPLLESIAAEEEASRRVIRCSARDVNADVAVVEDGRVIVGGSEIARIGPRVEADRSNLACALGAVAGLGVDLATVTGRLDDLPVAPHRQVVGRSERGFLIVDDTYNSNPAGARAALTRLTALAPDPARRVVVTPGMVELGPRRREENARFADEAAKVATHLVVVGRTNRAALLQGAGRGSAEVIVVPSRREAVEWVRGHLGEGDAVLYENDLPDHYP